MGIRIKFDPSWVPIEPIIVLANHNGNRVGTVTNISDIKFVDALTEEQNITFTVTKGLEGNNIWEYIQDMKTIYCVEWDVWMQIQVELDDSDSTIKNVTGKGLGQSELSQIYVHGLEFNTENDIERDDYERSIIYNFQNENASVLHKLFDKAPHYKIKHVDSSIASMQKTFSFDGQSIQECLNKIQEECHCLVVYNNSMNPETNMPAREISLYDIENICNDCGYRDEFTDVCPQCGSKNIKYGYGKDTRIFISKDNLTDEIVYTTDLDSVKTCFKLVAGDDVMTSAIQSCNPNGTDYIWYIPPNLLLDMPKELADKIVSYDELYNYYSKEHVINLDESLINEYNTLVDKYQAYNNELTKIESSSIVGYSYLMNIIYDIIDFDYFIQSSLMPIDDPIADTTAEKEAKKLTSESLSPIALNSVNEYMEDIINNMVLSVARIIVDKRYDVKIKESKIIYNESESEDKKHKWVGSFTITNYSDSDITADTGDILIFINKDYDTYIRQRVEKNLSEIDNAKDYSITNLLSLDKSLDDFKMSIKAYNISILMNLRDACDTCLDTLQSESIGNQGLWKDATDGVNMYEKYYLNYYNKLDALIKEIGIKEKDQKTIDNLRQYVTNERNAIQETLNFENYIGEELWLTFCTYRREDVYKNENYISDGLNNTEIFNNAREFYKIAQKELFKSATLQHSITSTLKNLLVIPEFRSLIDSFEVGNWIRIKVDEEVFRLRLVKYTIDFNDIDKISVEFSDVTKTADGITDINSLLSKTVSMSKSYDGVKRQATKGQESFTKVSDWVNNGFDATLSKIVDNRDTEDIIIDKHGLLIRSYDDVTESYDPTQMKFIHSTLALTDDNWKTIKTAIGNFIYQDPITKDFKSAYGVNGEVLVGKIILGQQLGIYNDVASMSFDENGLWVYNDKNSFRVNPNSNILMSLSKDDEKLLWVDENGMLHINGDGAGLDITANSSITGLQSQLKVTSDEIYATIIDTKSNLESQITQTSSEIRQELTDTANGLDSKITQTATDIRSEVADYKNGLESLIEQTATNIRSEVSDIKSGLKSEIEQTATSIRSEIEDVNSGLNSKIEQTATAIRSEITDADNKLQASINQTASEIRQEVKNVYDGLSTNITETAEQIRLESQSQYEGLDAKITINSDNIQSLVEADESIHSEITQTYNKLHLEVESEKTERTSAIELLDSSISSEVVRAKNREEEILSKVTQTANDLTIQIEKYERMKNDFNNTLLMNKESTSSQISALIINARNLCYQTSNEWEDVDVVDQLDFIAFSRKIYIKNKGIEVGDNIIVHFDIKFSDDFAPTETGTKNSYISIDKNPTGDTMNVSISSLKSKLESIISSPTKEGHISFNFKVTRDMIDETFSEYMTLYLHFDYYTGTVWWKNLMVEAGTKESPWIEAPEDVGVDNYFDVRTNVIQNNKSILLHAQRLDNCEASIEVNADKINFLVSGDKESSFSLTQDAITMISQNVLVKGAVTFESLNDDVKGKIEACVLNAITLYCLSNSNIEIPDKTTDTWISSVNWSEIAGSNCYVWQLVETTYGDGTVTRTDPVCISTGKEIKNVKTQYYLHNSSTNTPTGVTWRDTCPEYTSGKYIWTRSYITYTDDTIKTTTPIYDSGLTQANRTAYNAISTDLHQAYCGEEEPSGSHVEGDIWMKTGDITVTNDDNTTTTATGIISIYIWSDGRWIENKQGSTTITNGTIVTDLIASNAIVSSKIATDAIKSINYSGNTGTLSDNGSFFDLSNGNLSSKYFCLNQNGGIIGGWSISKTALYNTKNGSLILLQSSADSGSAFSVYDGGTPFNPGNPLFYVGSSDGHIYCASYIHSNDQISCDGKILENGIELSRTYAPISHSHSEYASSKHSHYTLSNGATVLVTSNMFGPYSTDDIACGLSNYRWTYVYAKSGTVSTSDEREKNILGKLDKRYKDLFMKLEPIMFTWKDDNFDNSKVHIGLGAQTTEKHAYECGISNNEIAAIQHDYFDPDKNGNTDRYGINYSEIQMLTLAVTQDNVDEINALKSRIEELENQLAILLS